jgi:hypothetical protein
MFVTKHADTFAAFPDRRVKEGRNGTKGPRARGRGRAPSCPPETAASEMRPYQV